MRTAKTVNVADPADYVRRFCRWVKEHPDRFKRVLHLIHMEVDRGNPCVQRGQIYKLAQDAGLPIADCDELRRDHNVWPALTRYAVMLRPRLARSLNFRESGCDHVDMQAIWREIVNPETVFLAENWQAAKRACEEGCVSAA